MNVVYLDASAIVKLCVAEAETAALVDHLRGGDRALTSELSLVEVGRAAARALGPTGLRLADEAVRRLDLLGLSPTILERARRLAPSTLRSLDAIHLASALEPRSAPVMVSYDEPLLQAAADHGLTTASPR